jgi:hypothetical protein
VIDVRKTNERVVDIFFSTVQASFRDVLRFSFGREPTVLTQLSRAVPLVTPGKWNPPCKAHADNGGYYSQVMNTIVFWDVA